jgi:hypothetical protein
MMTQPKPTRDELALEDLTHTADDLIAAASSVINAGALPLSARTLWNAGLDLIQSSDADVQRLGFLHMLDALLATERGPEMVVIGVRNKLAHNVPALALIGDTALEVAAE